MVDQTAFAISQRDRALLRTLLQGHDLQQIASVRGETAGQVRGELRRLFALLLTHRPPLAADPGRTAPRP
ncbi:hypothetical protein CKO28_06455 [Rhodovibrio sodomensis]|uniref:HTH luxR-type domain-containing protein n=1 Tax=Rhodovibrio sodomensis TaxID=1088 RepID=A0ABS1DB57_9PROT|nr:hypothetical protein [Rhodovibrio sodomensis]MBK1667674.1 hypothetical protein [Rhodovibrio sodomensis]